ncbi:MAG TPA: hypothetical protein VF624_07710 [Tepidisphaeraceae bacterium]|jgi:hypothetical protein
MKSNAALLMSVLALAISVYATVRSSITSRAPESETERIRRDIESQLVSDTWQEVEPIYKDMNLKVDKVPQNFPELMRILFSPYKAVKP